jgi:hypothetical protein
VNAAASLAEAYEAVRVLRAEQLAGGERFVDFAYLFLNDNEGWLVRSFSGEWMPIADAIASRA